VHRRGEERRGEERRGEEVLTEKDFKGHRNIVELEQRELQTVL